MGCVSVSTPGCESSGSSSCPDKFGCPPNQCPDFTIKRYDTQPSFKVAVEDENGPMDLTGLVLEANMWANAKLKAAIDDDDTSIAFADGIGFEQVLEGDVIIAQRTRNPEKMLITGFDETNKLITVERGHAGTTPSAWAKGTCLKIMRFANAEAVTEMVMETVESTDGTSSEEIAISYLVYEWSSDDTCAPGCFWLEFKLIKMLDELPSTSPVSTACSLADGVEWIRRFPSCGEFLIKICPSPTSEA